MSYTNSCPNCRHYQRACGRHNGSAGARPVASNRMYESDSDGGSPVFFDSSGNVAVGSSTGFGIDTANGDITFAGIDLGGGSSGNCAPNDTSTSSYTDTSTYSSDC